MYDVQIFSRYNDVYEEANLPDDDYDEVTAYLAGHHTPVAGDCTFSLYLPERADFHNRVKYEFPVVAIALSDYNAIREMLGYAPINPGGRRIYDPVEGHRHGGGAGQLPAGASAGADRRRYADPLGAALL